MKKRIAIIGSRNLACNITKWIVDSQEVEIIGGMFPPFEGWWKDEFQATLEEYNIPTFSDLDLLLEENPDVIFSINYWKKIDATQISKVQLGIINIHHSYLLKYKGRYSTSWAIMNARKLNCWEHGTTLHYIDERLDEGQIIDSWKCTITEDDTAETLFEKVEILAFEMFKSNFKKMLSPVREFLEPSKQSYFYDKNSNDLQIPINATTEDIYDFVRAWTFKDRPRPFILFNNKKIILTLENNKLSEV
jgi:methionyl-tRNA formyltransferase